MIAMIPISAAKPTTTSLTEKRASLLHSLISQAVARSIAPPIQKPPKQQIVGLLLRENESCTIKKGIPFFNGRKASLHNVQVTIQETDSILERLEYVDSRWANPSRILFSKSSN